MRERGYRLDWAVAVSLDAVVCELLFGPWRQFAGKCGKLQGNGCGEPGGVSKPQRIPNFLQFQPKPRQNILAFQNLGVRLMRLCRSNWTQRQPFLRKPGTYFFASISAKRASSSAMRLIRAGIFFWCISRRSVSFIGLAG